MLRKLAIAISALTLMAGALVLPRRHRRRGSRSGCSSCNVSSGFGFIFGSSRSLNCTESPGPGHPEHYVGTINKFGVDIGYINGGVLVWSVVAPTATPLPCSLAGTYSAPPPTPRSGSGPGPTCWSAATATRSRCSRSASRAPPVSTSPPASPR